MNSVEINCVLKVANVKSTCKILYKEQSSQVIVEFLLPQLLVSHLLGLYLLFSFSPLFNFLVTISIFLMSMQLSGLISPSAGYLTLEIKLPLRVAALNSGYRLWYSFSVDSPCLL